MPRRRPIDHDFTPLICKECGDVVRIRVDVTMIAPLGWKNLTKDGIRSKHVTVEKAAWDMAEFICSCRNAIPRMTKGKKSSTEEKLEKLEELKEVLRKSRGGRGNRAGQRWAKNHTPRRRGPWERANHPSSKAPKKK